MRNFHYVIPVLGLTLALCLALTGCSGNGGGNDGGNEDACGLDAGCGTDDSGPIACTGIGDCPSHNLCLGGTCQIGTICTGVGTDECPSGYTCNVLKEVCVPETLCTGDPDCTDAAAPKCLVGDGVCVQCLVDGDCPGTPGEVFCNPSYECQPVGPSCTVATEAQDCTEPGRTHCDPVQQVCVGCADDAHCPGGTCRLDLHTCVECTMDNHCVSPLPHCHLDTNTCVECVTDAQCGGTERCNASTHSCTDLVCASDNDCVGQAGPYCDTGTGDCVICLEHGHCGANAFCRGNACESGCTSDAECAEKNQDPQSRCDLGTSHCFVAECLTDADCTGNPDGERCKTAAAPSNPPQYSCVQCTDDAHCPNNFNCTIGTNKFICEPRPCYDYPDPDDFCAQVNPCYVCDLGVDGQCVPREDCSFDPCCQGYTCNTFSNCERNLNCSDDLDCPVDSICNQQTAQCEYQSACGDCQPGWFCNEQTGICEEGECKQAMEMCDMAIQNCCPGLTCTFMGCWQI